MQFLIEAFNLSNSISDELELSELGVASVDVEVEVRAGYDQHFVWVLDWLQHCYYHVVWFKVKVRIRVEIEGDGETIHQNEFVSFEKYCYSICLCRILFLKELIIHSEFTLQILMQPSAILSLLQTKHIRIDKGNLRPEHRLPVLRLQVLRVDAVLEFVGQSGCQHIVGH